jgi:hypothetical protein
MLHTPDNSKGKILVDAKGNKVNLVKSFDDTTEVAEIYISATNGNYEKTSIVMVETENGGLEDLVVKVKMKGAKIIDKKYFGK